MAYNRFARVKLESKRARIEPLARIRYQNTYAHVQSKRIKQLKNQKQKGK